MFLLLLMKNSNKFQNRLLLAAIIPVSVFILIILTIIPFSYVYSQSFNIKDFKIIKFGVENHNPFVVVQGKAGGTRGDDSGDNEFGYVFDTDKGLYGAFSAFPNQPYTSSHLTQKNVNGHTCLDKAQRTGHAVISGHKLTITGININNVKKAWTELSFVDTENGNCVNKIFSSKTGSIDNTLSSPSTNNTSTSTTSLTSTCYY